MYDVDFNIKHQTPQPGKILIPGFFMQIMKEGKYK